ncbi:hypothetical protein DVA67_008400 [Solirubrobacter sp. CPCC 204708]|uniref:Uncharacterized protein n=1 Tax=Solirubrobacter deserti TaxID=2282478 RepID=A0ABT4RDX8_9ACTN|nr:hypothetical protein [Solirubrobacter deserti]MBE2315992.1 hypothetical protein [Solirubrobacter deserti]MDA0136744.1 hypothetical protein [Solirubrobacter deserti]
MPPVARTIAGGAAAGLAGAAAMALTARLEQLFTHRPSSFVPAKTLAHLLRLSKPDDERIARNLAMHFGTGALAGVLRGTMSAANLRGPWASAMHTHLRLSIDQMLENATGVGAPPWTWPRDELVIDVAHKAVFSFTTGAITDRLIAPAPGSSARRRALGARLKGRA